MRRRSAPRRAPSSSTGTSPTVCGASVFGVDVVACATAPAVKLFSLTGGASVEKPSSVFEPAVESDGRVGRAAQSAAVSGLPVLGLGSATLPLGAHDVVRERNDAAGGIERHLAGVDDGERPHDGDLGALEPGRLLELREDGRVAQRGCCSSCRAFCSWSARRAAGSVSVDGMMSTASVQAGDVRSPPGQSTSGFGLETSAHVSEPMTCSPLAPRRPFGARPGARSAYWCARVHAPFGGGTEMTFERRVVGGEQRHRERRGSVCPTVRSMPIDRRRVHRARIQGPVSATVAVDSKGNPPSVPR